MRRIKKGIVIDKIKFSVCHNPKCTQGGRIGTKVEPYLCKQCNYMEYCSPHCKEIHWNATHKYVCKELPKINFIESMVLTARCPLNGKHGLHKHPKINNDKIYVTRWQINYHADKLTNKDTSLACSCSGKVGKREDIAATVMMEEIPCMNMNLVHVFIRCKDFNCKHRKNADPLYDLCPVSPSHKILIVIPHQKGSLSTLDFINNDAEHIRDLPEEYDQMMVEAHVGNHCEQCGESHIQFRLIAKRTKENNNDNVNVDYVYNDVKDKWEFLIYSQ